MVLQWYGYVFVLLSSITLGLWTEMALPIAVSDIRIWHMRRSQWYVFIAP